MAIEQITEAVKEYDLYRQKHGLTEAVMDAYLAAIKTAFFQDRNKEYGLSLTDKVKSIINDFVVEQTGGDIWKLELYSQRNDVEYYWINVYYEILKLESFYLFESFILYMEHKRDQSKRFYHPRRKTLKIVVDDMQDLEDDKISFYGLSMPSRVGKSTMGMFFLAWVSLRKPNSHNALGGHSGVLAKGFYKELINFMTTEEYCFFELYSFFWTKYARKKFPTYTSAEDFTITLGSPDRFATITCRGIDGTWTGAVDVSADGYLYVDDLVRDREHSLSPQRMETTYQEYLNKMVDRKIDGAKELMVGTLWNVQDPLNRIKIQYEHDPRYRFRKIPALNENDESNFDYEINGFSTDYYKKMRDILDNAEWMAKYQQDPYVREGLLFPSNELRYLDSDIADGEVNVIAVCDPAFGGADSLSMPICLQEKNGRKIIIDWVHKKGTQSVTVPMVVEKIAKHHITELHIEQNAGGKLMSDSIRNGMKARGIQHCRIVPYWASVRMSKAQKIIGYSDWVKENFVFLMENRYARDDFMYRRSEQYQSAMNEMHMYTSEGKNDHDDAPDAITQLAIVLGTKQKQTVIVEGFF